MRGSLQPVLGAQLRDLHRSRELTQEGLAEQLGATPRCLAGIGRGERNLALDSVDALAVQRTSRLGHYLTCALIPSGQQIRMRYSVGVGLESPAS